MKISRFISILSLSLLLASLPTTSTQAQSGLLKGLSKVGKRVGKATGMAVSKTMTKGTKTMSKSTRAAEKAKWVKEVSRSKKGLEITNRARILAGKTLYDGAAWRAAERTTQKLIEKGGVQALETVTNAELRQLVLAELSREELKSLARNAIVGGPYTLLKMTKENENKRDQTSAKAIKKAERPDSIQTDQHKPVFFNEAQNKAKQVFTGNDKIIEELLKDLESNAYMSYLLSHDQLLIKAYERASGTYMRNDPIVLNYLAYTSDYNKPLTENFLNTDQLRLSNTKNRDLLNINEGDKCLAIIGRLNPILAKQEGCNFMFRILDQRMLDLYPMKNATYDLTKTRLYQMSNNHVYFLDKSDQATGSSNCTYKTDNYGRVIKFSHMLNRSDLAKVKISPRADEIARYALTHTTLGSELIKEVNLKDYKPIFLYPITSGGTESYINIVPAMKNARKRFDKLEKTLYKQLNDKSTTAVNYEVTVSYPDALTLLPNNITIITTCYHSKKGALKHTEIIQNL